MNIILSWKLAADDRIRRQPNKKKTDDRDRKDLHKFLPRLVITKKYHFRTTRRKDFGSCRFNPAFTGPLWLDVHKFLAIDRKKARGLREKTVVRSRTLEKCKDSIHHGHIRRIGPIRERGRTWPNKPTISLPIIHVKRPR